MEKKRLELDGNGMVWGGPFDGLYLKPLLAAFRNSSFDWPATIRRIGLGDRVNGDTLHPGMPELRALQALSPHEVWTRVDLQFDT